MQFENPVMTVENVDGPEWLVTVQHSFSDAEAVQLTVRVPKGNTPIGDVQREAVSRAIKLLTLLTNKPA